MASIRTDSKKVLETGSELRRLRIRLGISQEELAHEIGVEQSLISKIELDRVKSIHTRLQISAALGAWVSN